MSETIAIERNEGSKIRVFAVSRAPADMRAALDAAPRADVARDLLGDPHLNTASTEVFPVSDLAGVGLGAYLTEGYAVDADVIAADRAKLDALDGYVLLLFSDSFGGAESRLSPGPDLTLIGTYEEYRPDEGVPAALSADSAMPYPGVPGEVPAPPARSGAGSAMVVFALLVLLGLLVWWLLT